MAHLKILKIGVSGRLIIRVDLSNRLILSRLKGPLVFVSNM